MRQDPIVAEVRTVRERLAAEFDFDVRAIFADLRKRQAAHGDRLVRQRKPAEARSADERLLCG
jgi:hypothetical protein